MLREGLHDGGVHVNRWCVFMVTRDPERPQRAAQITALRMGACEGGERFGVDVSAFGAHRVLELPDGVRIASFSKNSNHGGEQGDIRLDFPAVDIMQEMRGKVEAFTGSATLACLEQGSVRLLVGLDGAVAHAAEKVATVAPFARFRETADGGGVRDHVGWAGAGALHPAEDGDGGEGFGVSRSDCDSGGGEAWVRLGGIGCSSALQEERERAAPASGALEGAKKAVELLISKAMRIRASGAGGRHSGRRAGTRRASECMLAPCRSSLRTRAHPSASARGTTGHCGARSIIPLPVRAVDILAFTNRRPNKGVSVPLLSSLDIPFRFQLSVKAYFLNLDQLPDFFLLRFWDVKEL